MPDDNQPLIKLEPGGKAPILSYNVPEPTTYSGPNFIELEDRAQFFKSNAFEVPVEPVEPQPPRPPIGPLTPGDTIAPVTEIPPATPQPPPRVPPETEPPPSRPGEPPRHLEKRVPLGRIELSNIKNLVEEGMKAGFADRRIFPNAQFTTGGLRFVESNPALKIESSLAVSRKLQNLTSDEIARMLKEGKRLNIFRSLFGTLTYNFIQEPEPTAHPRLLLVETYRLSSFLGSYGAGRIVKTFTLLPGEKTKISVRTFMKSEQERKSASSILDSVTEESAEEFQQSLEEEQSNKETYEKSFEYHSEASAKAGWGWGSAKVSGGVKGGTNSSREEFAKNVSNATQKHSSTASAKRDVQINTSYEVTETAEEETSIQRELENINLSRTLNFVFRQMNQEFITLLHLVDVRVAFFNGFAETRREVTLPDLDLLLAEFVVEDRHGEVRQNIVDALQTVFDHTGEMHNIVEQVTIDDDLPYLRIRRDLISVYKDEVTGTEIAVPGVILSTLKNVMRTEGVMVEALLGEGDALDAYATRLQELEVARRETEVARDKTQAERAALLNQLVRDNDTDRAKLLVDLTCPCGPDRSPLEVTVHMHDKREAT